MESVCVHDDMDRLLKAMGKLNSQQQITLHYRFWHQLTLKEVGEKIGKSTERARMIISSALVKLEKTLTCQPIFDRVQA